MLKERTNTFGATAAALTTEKAMHPAVRSAVQQALPDSSASEEDIEDWSSSEEKEQPQLNQHRPLSRLVRGATKPEPRPTAPAAELEDDDDLAADLGRLGLGTGAQRQAPPKAVEPASPSPTEGDSSDGDDFSPFFERKAPTVNLFAGKGVGGSAAGGTGRGGKEGAAAAAAGGGASNIPEPGQPEPGSMVFQSQRSPQHRFVLPAAVATKLYPHQVQGVKWLWSLHELGRGGILGDDMGLGKTMQCAAFLAGMFGGRIAQRALIIAPKTLLPHWIKELAACGLGQLTREFFGASEGERAAALRCAASGRAVLVTTYGMVQHNAEQLVRGPSRGYGAGRDEDEGLLWDFIFLDEGHKIKNPKTKLVEQLRRLSARVQVVISGTPIQNNLMEMQALFDYTTPGLLDDARAFKKTYEKPITKGLDKEATDRERRHGAAIADMLRETIAPYFLRREKKDVLPDNSDRAAAGGGAGASGSGGSAGAPSSSAAGSASAAGAQPVAGAEASSGAQQERPGLPRKNDLVVWLRLTDLQKHIYKAFLHTDNVREVLNKAASPLAAITVLKKICDHPALLSQRAASSVITGAHRWAKGKQDAGATGGKGGAGRRPRRTSLDDFIVDSDEEEDEDEEDSEEDEGEEDEGEEAGSGDESPSRSAARPAGSSRSGAEGDDMPEEWSSVDVSSLDAQLLKDLEQRGAEASCKSAFVLALLKQLTAEGHRTLIFSQSKVMISILEAGVRAMRLAYCRIDGDVSSAEERQALVNRFQTNPSIPVFLLTSQVGGLGLTLTAADRVVIVDPNFNPSIDNQSVDRAYRMGQKRDVVVYRLITCGTVEEKIYRKQVFKGGLSRTGTEDGVQFRYFTQTELRDLFHVSDEGLATSATQLQLAAMHSGQRRATPQLAEHLQQLERVEGVAGIHDHDLLFSMRPDEPQLSALERQAIINEHTGAGLLGVDLLASQLGGGMRISGPPRGAPADPRQAELAAAREELHKAEAQIASKRSALAIAANLDNGERMQGLLRSLQQQLEEAKARVRQLEGGGPGGAPQGAAGAPARERQCDAGTRPAPAPAAAGAKPLPQPPGGAAGAGVAAVGPAGLRGAGASAPARGAPAASGESSRAGGSEPGAARAQQPSRAAGPAPAPAPHGGSSAGAAAAVLAAAPAAAPASAASTPTVSATSGGGGTSSSGRPRPAFGAGLASRRAAAAGAASPATSGYSEGAGCSPSYSAASDVTSRGPDAAHTALPAARGAGPAAVGPALLHGGGRYGGGGAAVPGSAQQLPAGVGGRSWDAGRQGSGGSARPVGVLPAAAGVVRGVGGGGAVRVAAAGREAARPAESAASESFLTAGSEDVVEVAGGEEVSSMARRPVETIDLT